MAEILGVGLSHYPGPLVPEEYWSSMLQRNVDVGRIPAAVYADKSRWPAEMIREMGNDNGTAAAHAHKARLKAGYNKLRAEIDAFKPDVVVIWGDDQYENFKQECVPAFCVYVMDTYPSRPFVPQALPFKTTQNVWGVPSDHEFGLRGHKEAGRALACELLNGGFDIAYAYAVRAPAGLAHSFNNTVLYLDWDKKGFPYPILPFHVNCYGNQLLKTAADASGESIDERSPPAPTPQRCFEIGRATARFFMNSPWRTCLIASSSWSHASLTVKHDRLYPDIPADRARVQELREGTFKRWREIPLEQIEDAGQNEFLNWVCLAGAMSETGQRAEVLDFVESHVFNSSKCFALFRAQQQRVAAE